MNNDISRRSLLVGSTALLPGMGLIKSVGAQTPPKRPILGDGEFKYECYHDWLTPPDNLKWGDTHGLALDSHGRIYVSHTVHPSSVSSDAIVVYDHKGKFITSWGAQFRGGGHGLDLRKEGSEEFLYHCDVAHRKVVKTDLNGKVIWEKGAPMESGVYPKEENWCPTNVAFDPNGDLFVGDGYGSSYVHRYSKDGEYKGIVVRPGKDPGFVSTPHGLWVDTRSHTPKLVVADRGNRRLQEFTLDGKHISIIKDGMREPCHIHYNHGLVLVPDLDSVITVLDKDNKPVASLGDGANADGSPSGLRDAPRDQFIPGKFVHPHAAIWMNKKDILVVEWVPIGRVTLLRNVA